MKKLFSLFLAALMIMALSTTLFADEPASTTPTATITVTEDRTYEVYQIFTGDLSGSTLSNIKWGKNGQKADGTAVTEGTAVDKNILDELKDVNGKSDAEKLAVIEKYVSQNSDNKFGTVSKNSPLNNVPTGYYLLKDVTSTGAGQEKSEFVVKLVGDVTITAKAGTVVPGKEVKEKNDSTGVESWGTAADYDIGDDVPFKLTGKVSDKYDNYKEYYFCFHDTLSSGLTFNADSVKVYVDGMLIENTTDKTYYTVNTADTGLKDNNCTFEVEFTDLKNISFVHAGSTITVEYTAKLNENAVVGSIGNSNKMQIKYSNDPNGFDRGTTTPIEVKVYTYKCGFYKVDDSSPAQPLKGAGFTLYKKIKDDNGERWVAVGGEKTGSGTNENEFVWEGLDAGTYKLVETTTPPGYNTMADKEFDINEDQRTLPYSLSSIVNHKGTVLPETGAGGTALFIGIGSALAIVAVVCLVTRKKMSVYGD